MPNLVAEFAHIYYVLLMFVINHPIQTAIIAFLLYVIQTGVAIHKS